MEKKMSSRPRSIWYEDCFEARRAFMNYDVVFGETLDTPKAFKKFTDWMEEYFDE